MKNIRGFFLKQMRAERGYSLEEVSHDICSPSYLSRLENGEAVGSDEIYDLLLSKLDAYIPDKEKLLAVKKQIDAFFKYYLNSDQNAYYIAEELLEKEDEVRYTSLYLYFRIFKLYAMNQGFHVDYYDDDLSEYEPYMDTDEKLLYEMYKNTSTDLIDSTAVQIFKLRSQGNNLYQRGRWLAAYDLYRKALWLSAQNGDTVSQCDILMELGRVSAMMDVSVMEDYYLSAVRMNGSASVKAKAYYNMGTAFLMYDGYHTKAKECLLTGLNSCKDEISRQEFYRILFIYSGIYEPESKNTWYEKLEEPESFVRVMYENEDYMHHEDYAKELQKLKEDNALYHYLYLKNLMENGQYKEACYELMKKSV